MFRRKVTKLILLYKYSSERRRSSTGNVQKVETEKIVRELIFIEETDKIRKNKEINSDGSTKDCMKRFF